MLCTIILGFFSCIQKENSSNNNKYKRNAVFFDIDTAITYPKEVISLTVRNNSFDKFIINYDKFINLKFINLADLSYNKLAIIFECLSNLEKLDDLEISDFDSCEIPNNIFKLKNLKVLDIQNEKKFNLPDSLSYCSNLEILVAYNYNTLPKELYKLKKLKSISLGWQIKSFPKELLEMPNIERISLHGEIEELPNDIIKLKKLRCLNLALNPIADKERNYFIKHKKYDKLQFLVEQMPQCKLILEWTAK